MSSLAIFHFKRSGRDLQLFLEGFVAGLTAGSYVFDKFCGIDYIVPPQQVGFFILAGGVEWG